MQQSSLWSRFILPRKWYQAMVFLSCGGWCLVFSRCRRSECRCEGPTGTCLGVCVPLHPLCPLSKHKMGVTVPCHLHRTPVCLLGKWDFVSPALGALGLWQESRDGLLLFTGEGGASQERTSGQACCSVSVQRTWWCLASILLLLKLHVRGVLADVYKIPFHMFLKTTLTWEAPLLLFWMLICNHSRRSWFIWKSEGTLKAVGLMCSGSFCVETCLVFFTGQNCWIWPWLSSCV